MCLFALATESVSCHNLITKKWKVFFQPSRSVVDADSDCRRGFLRIKSAFKLWEFGEGGVPKYFWISSSHGMSEMPIKLQARAQTSEQNKWDLRRIL